MTCLPTSKEVQQVIFGSDGLASGPEEGTPHCRHDDGDPNATREMAKPNSPSRASR